MAKKKKGGGKAATARRAKRGKQAEENDTIMFDGESSTAPEISTPSSGDLSPSIITSSESSTSQEPSTSNQEKQHWNPTIILHKKFGKYRCLFSDDVKKYDLGSDSETNSSLEVRVVDPSASSESDSNAAGDSLDSAKTSVFKSVEDDSKGSMLAENIVHDLDSIPMPSVSREAIEPANIPIPELPVLLENIPLPPPRINILENNEIELPSGPPLSIPVSSIPLPSSRIPEDIKIENVNKCLSDKFNIIPVIPKYSVEKHIMYTCIPDRGDNYDYSTVKEDETANLLDNLNINQPENLEKDMTEPTKEPAQETLELVPTTPESEKTEDTLMAEPTVQADPESDYDDDDEVITVVQIVEDDENPEEYYNIEMSNEKLEEQDSPNAPSEIQKDFEKLNVETKDAQPCSPMDCSNSKTLDLPESISRPDPSITPSSTLSDDSNCSRPNSEHQSLNNSADSAESSPTGVRRSSRIKTIGTLKQKSKGLVKTPLKKALITQAKMKLEEAGSDSQERSMDMPVSVSPTFPVPIDMPVKVKSRWRRSSELEMCTHSPANSPIASPGLPSRLTPVSESGEKEEQSEPLSKEAYDKIIQERLSQYQHLQENDYLCERMISRDAKKMICDCFLTKEEIERGEMGCGEDCLNRLLMIECNSRCPVADRCTNRRFQKFENGPLQVFYADKKGCGIEASENISTGEFLMEYVGEVLDYDLFYKRAQAYSDENNLHHYFMSLKGDTVIDATLKGNISRFINHSCEPNAETQKWTVNGELRIGFFSKRDIKSGEEITFDYQFQRFGKEAQRCYCGADNCRGWIGAEPDSEDDYDEDEDDVSTSKSVSSETSDKSRDASVSGRPEGAARRRKPRRARKYTVPQAELAQDADIEEDIEVLSRTGVKNQWHTLRLSRSMVRAKGRGAQAALLRLLRDADLPCRRLFLDYRGLRLLAPWCADHPPHAFRLEMLQAVDRLPIPNKTMVQESRFISVVEKWLTAADTEVSNVFIDEATGLPIELPNKSEQETSPDKAKDPQAIADKVKDLCKQLLERWSSLKEVFRIPKKERIQQMKEHERQANVERRAADSSGSRDRERARDERSRDERSRDRRDDHRDRDRDRDKHRDRDRERDRERDRDRDDRDRRKRRSSPDGRRSIRLSDRVLAAVPPMSKEERRRAFAEAAAAAEETRRQTEQKHWAQWESFAQMFPPGMMPPNMMPPNMMNMPPNMAGLHTMPPGMPNMPPGMANIPPSMANMPPGLGNMPPGMGNMHPGIMPPMGMMGGQDAGEWLGGEFPGQPGFNPHFPHQFVMHQPNFVNMGNFGMGPGMPPGMMYPQPAFPGQETAPPQLAHDLPATDTEVVLPSMWRSACDDRGRTYYYHVKHRQPQWVPPPPPLLPAGGESSSEEEEVPQEVETSVVRRSKGKLVEGVKGIYEVIKEDSHSGLIPDHALVNKPRKRRPGLVSERPISPRTEEDKLAGRLEVKRYKETKEKLRRRRDRLLQKFKLLQQASKKKHREFTQKDLQMAELIDTDSDSDSDPEELELPAMVVEPAAVATIEPEIEDPAQDEVDADEAARRIKESFRSSMARVMVHHLNPYRHRTAPLGRITNTADFKHLARKLTHFVMLKELKHCRAVEELIVTDSVRSKAKEFVKKYMAKFGPVYNRPVEEAD